jgi:hypothetical protein
MGNGLTKVSSPGFQFLTRKPTKLFLLLAWWSWAALAAPQPCPWSGLNDLSPDQVVDSALARVQAGEIGAGFRVSDPARQKEIDRLTDEVRALGRQQSALVTSSGTLSEPALQTWRNLDRAIAERQEQIDALVGQEGASRRLRTAALARAGERLDDLLATAMDFPLKFRSGAPPIAVLPYPGATRHWGWFRFSRTFEVPRAYTESQRRAVREAFRAALAENAPAQDPRDFIELASAVLESQGVAHRIRNDLLMGTWSLEILPQENGTALLNRLAYQLQQKHGTRLRYRPQEMLGGASYHPSVHFIDIPSASVLDSSLIDVRLGHEIGHSHTDSLLARGLPYAFYGQWRSMDGPLPYSLFADTDTLYRNAYGIDEIDKYRYTYAHRSQVYQKFLDQWRDLGIPPELGARLKGWEDIREKVDRYFLVRTFDFARQTELLADEAIHALRSNQAKIHFIPLNGQMHAMFYFPVGKTTIELDVPLAGDKGGSDADRKTLFLHQVQAIRDSSISVRDRAAQDWKQRGLAGALGPEK